MFLKGEEEDGRDRRGGGKISPSHLDAMMTFIIYKVEVEIGGSIGLY